MLFGALFSAYILLRVGAEAWPHHLLPVGPAALNTALLITSSMTMTLSWAALREGQVARHRQLLVATIARGRSTLRGLPRSLDVRATASCLAGLVGRGRGALEAWASGPGAADERGPIGLRLHREPALREPVPHDRIDGLGAEGL